MESKKPRIISKCYEKMNSNLLELGTPASGQTSITTILWGKVFKGAANGTQL